MEGASVVDGVQVVADSVFVSSRAARRRPGSGARLHQVFANDIPPASLVAATFALPIERFRSPILGDVDGNGTVSCDDACRTDPDDLGATCGYPDPFPACDLAKPVLVNGLSDCLIASDAVPGNAICDIAPGAYGQITVARGGRLNLLAGDYTACGIIVGNDSIVSSSAPATMFITGDVLGGSNTAFGDSCGDLNLVVAGRGRIRFKDNSLIAASVCAPQSSIQTGRNNVLITRFVASSISIGRDTLLQCCAGASSPGCGDGEITPPETCDPLSEPIGCPVGRYCRIDCSGCDPSCGDGILVDPEVCEWDFSAPGQCPDGHLCRHDCSGCDPICGDDLPSPPEPCDPPQSEGVCGPGSVCKSACAACATCPTPFVVPPAGGTFMGTTSGEGLLEPDGFTFDAISNAPERTYQWTPTVTGRARIQTCGNGTTFDTVLYVREGTCGGEQTARNDDACGRRSRVMLDVVAAETYTIVVDGRFGGASGNFVLDIRPPS
jgi:hypothetical protein